MSGIYNSYLSCQTRLAAFRQRSLPGNAARRLLSSRFQGSHARLHSSAQRHASTLALPGTSLHPVRAKALRGSRSLFYKRAGIAGVGLGLAAFGAPVIYCDGTPSRPSSPAPATATPPPAEADSTMPPPPQSSVNIYELSFGTVCGLCAGVFIKKGAKALAFFLGGVFVLLQYLGQSSLIRVDWQRAGQRFENLFYTKNADGTKRAPTVGSLFSWIVDFLTADFQPRASFVAGLILGLRVG